jgi:hypothetical protein
MRVAIASVGFAALVFFWCQNAGAVATTGTVGRRCDKLRPSDSLHTKLASHALRRRSTMRRKPCKSAQSLRLSALLRLSLYRQLRKCTGEELVIIQPCNLHRPTTGQYQPSRLRRSSGWRKTLTNWTHLNPTFRAPRPICVSRRYPLSSNCLTSRRIRSEVSKMPPVAGRQRSC